MAGTVLEIDIEKALCPDVNKLKKEKDYFISTITDEELDEIKCSFLNDGCVHMDTKDYSYICLSKEKLKILIALIEKAENRKIIY